MPFKPFVDDWVSIDNLLNLNKFIGHTAIPLPVKLESDFFTNLKFDVESFKEYRYEACKASVDMIGSNPALCLSGGVDSQYMVQSFIEAGYNFDVVMLVFDKDLNRHDVATAKLFCDKNNIKLKEIKIDILNFLRRDNYDIGVKYMSASPHFNAHYKLFDILNSQGYTGVVCGGNTPIRCPINNTWGENFRRNNLNFVNYTKVSGFPCVGDFISFHPKLAWALSLITGQDTRSEELKQYVQFAHLSHELSQERYKLKCNSYTRSGIEIVPQDCKYTGFEFVKDYFKDLDDDEYSFDKKFRWALEQKLNIVRYESVLEFKDGVQSLVNDIHNKNIAKRKLIVKNIQKINRNAFNLH